MMKPTREECLAKAMFLGMSYDVSDHTFYKFVGVNDDGVNMKVLCADTMEPVYMSSDSYENSREVDYRTRMVDRGEIGTKHEAYKKPLHWET